MGRAAGFSNMHDVISSATQAGHSSGTLQATSHLSLPIVKLSKCYRADAGWNASVEVHKSLAQSATGLQKLAGRPEPSCQFDRACPAKHVQTTRKAWGAPASPCQLPRGSSSPAGFSQGCHTLLLPLTLTTFVEMHADLGFMRCNLIVTGKYETFG